MRVLVTGASGFIGSAVSDALEQQGHDVIRATRRGTSAVDLAQVPGKDWWLPQLAGVDVVVNAVGILREQGQQTFRALHTDAPIELFKACAEAGVAVVQISALGADEAATSRYHLSKKAADDALRSLPMSSTIVQPSLVYGPGGSSARLFNQLAVLPVLALPNSGAMQVQPVHLDDVVAGVLAVIESPPQGTYTISFVGPRAMSLREYLAQLRSSLGVLSRQLVLPWREHLFLAAAGVAAHFPGSSLDRETAGMLLRGNTGPRESFAQLLGRPPRPVDQFIVRREAAPLRTEAVLGVWLPVLRIAIALMWIWTGIVAPGLYPLQDSYALLARVGLQGTVATLALYGAAALSVALGVLTLAPRAGNRRPVWAGQLLLIAAYTLLITVFLPEYWLHPYGPIIKNLPLMAAIALAWALEPPAQSMSSWPAVV